MHPIIRIVLIAALMGLAPTAWAGKCGPVLNPVLDINWQCIFPIKIGGAVEFGTSDGDYADKTEDPLCTCMKGPVPYFGLSASYWEPFAIMDTVTDAWCFMPLGTEVSAGTPGKLNGATRRKAATTNTFAQAHYYKFPVFKLLDMFADLPCNDDSKSFDLALMTEVIPTWNDDILALMLNPEAVLFGNPITQLACAADVASTLITGSGLNALFWCMGSWGGSYPIAGSVTGDDVVQANAAVAAKGIFMLSRTNILADHAENICGTVFTPIWRKNHYKMQLMKPVRDSQCRAIGEPGILWSHMKNPPMAGDNFSWLILRKNRCCVGY